jgi:hypothetical protein
MPAILEILCAPSLDAAANFAQTQGWSASIGSHYWRHGKGDSITIVKVIDRPDELAATPGHLKVHMRFPEGVPAEWAAALAKRNPSPNPYQPMDTAPSDRRIRVYDAKRRVWHTCAWRAWSPNTADTSGGWFIVGTAAWIDKAACWMDCEDCPPEEIIAAALPKPKDAA